MCTRIVTHYVEHNVIDKKVIKQNYKFQKKFYILM